MVILTAHPTLLVIEIDFFPPSRRNLVLTTQRDLHVLVNKFLTVQQFSPVA